MKKNSIKAVGISYFTLLLSILYIAIVGDYLYLAELQEVKLVVYHSLLTFFFTAPLFALIQLNVKIEVVNIIKNQQFILSLSLFSLFLVVTSLLYEGNFHTLVPMALRMFYVGIEIALIYLVFYINISLVLILKDKFNSPKQEKQQEA